MRMTRQLGPPPPRLKTLAARAGNHPPRRTPALRELQRFNDFGLFKQIVAELVPDRSDHILEGGSDIEIINRFHEEIDGRYFTVMRMDQEFAEEIAETPEENVWEYMVRGARPELYGFLIEEAHEFTEWIQSGIRPAEGIMPIVLGIGQVAGDEDSGVRVTWREAAAERFGRDLIGRIPEHGYDFWDVIKALDDAGFTESAMAFRWIASGTGIQILDEQLGPDEPFGINVDWEIEAMNAAAEAWNVAMDTWERIKASLEWMDNDHVAAFNRILDIIEAAGCEEAEYTDWRERYGLVRNPMADDE